VIKINRAIWRTALVASIAGLGFEVAHAIPRNSPAVVTRMPPLLGRHLQPPWWEAVVQSAPSPSSVRITIPSAVLFATNSSALTERGDRALQQLFPEMRGAVRISIAGCTDSVGGSDSPYNIALSWSRARSARKELVALGLNPELFRLSALADTHPVVGTLGLDQATVNALNRRIVISVMRPKSG
jgi:flagellar motor protein MotB